MPLDAPRSYRRIEDYAPISNCRGCALVARDGAIDWACLTHFDAAPVFSRLLDAERGGFFAIRPEERFDTARIYLRRTNILETTFTTATGVVTLHDFMLPTDGHAERPSLVRLVTGVSGSVAMEAVYRPLAGFAESFAELAIADGRVTGPGCPLLAADARFEAEDGCAVVRFTLAGLEDRSFVLYGAQDVEHTRTARPKARNLMETARRAWTGWAASALYDGPLADELTRSALVLKALTYEPSGAIVAGATADHERRLAPITATESARPTFA